MLQLKKVASTGIAILKRYPYLFDKTLKTAIETTGGKLKDDKKKQQHIRCKCN